MDYSLKVQAWDMVHPLDNPYPHEIYSLLGNVVHKLYLMGVLTIMMRHLPN